MLLSRIYYRLSKCLMSLYGPRMIYYKKNFQGKKTINLRIGNTTFIDHPGKLQVADHVYIGHHNFIEASNSVTIEKGCQITSFVSLTSHSSHHSIRLYGSHYGETNDHIGYQTGEVYIGKFTFIGPHTTIMPGTKIGKGCIVSAYSLLKGEYPDFSVIAGNPAVVVGSVQEKDQKIIDEYPLLANYYMQ